MEDVLQKVTARFTAEDLERMRQIIYRRDAYVAACRALVAAEFAVEEAASKLDDSIEGLEPSDFVPSLDPEERLKDVLDQNSSFTDGFDNFAFIPDDDPLSMFYFEAKIKVFIDAEDDRVSGEREVEMFVLYPKQMQGVLVAPSGEAEVHGFYDFWFAMSVDLNGPPEQAVSLSCIESSEHYGASGDIQRHIEKDDGRVDA